MILVSLSKHKTSAIDHGSFDTPRDLRQSNVDRVSKFELVHIPSDFCDYTGAIIADFIWKAISVITAVCLARGSTYESFNANLRAPSALLTSIGFMLAA